MAAQAILAASTIFEFQMHIFRSTILVLRPHDSVMQMTVLPAERALYALVNLFEFSVSW